MPPPPPMAPAPICSATSSSSATAAGLKAHPAGYNGTRFLTPEYLKEGDEFIPLIAGKSKSGKEIAAVAPARRSRRRRKRSAAVLSDRPAAL